jgi:hypothetical protein
MIRSVNGPETVAKVRDLIKSMGLTEYRAWPLPNLRTCSEADFWHHRSIYHFDAELYVGNIELRPGVHASVMPFVQLGGHIGPGGFVVARVLSCSDRAEIERHVATGHGGDPYKWPVEHYRWGTCVHEFAHRSGGNCYHVYTCKLCGHRYDIDSSD